MGLKMIADYMLVEKPDATKSNGGLFINAPVDPAAPRLAKVLAMGPGRFSDYTGDLIPMPAFQVGDMILIHGGAGIKVPSEGDNVYAMQPRDVIAVQPSAVECTCGPGMGCDECNGGTS